MDIVSNEEVLAGEEEQNQHELENIEQDANLALNY